MRLLLVAFLPLISANAATILFSDLGTGTTVYDPNLGSTVKGSGSGGNSIVQARPFTVAGSGNFLVTQIDLGLVHQTGVATFTASLWTTASGHPGTALASWNLPIGVQLGNCCGLATQTGITGVTLAAGTQYFMVAGPQSLSDNSFNQWQFNTQGAVATQFGSLDGGANWINDGTGTNLAFDVLGVSTPEPGSVLLLAAGLAGMLAAAGRKARFRRI